ncbi:hypothetical protein C5167_015911, partial [Papaver somniferum]
EEEERKLVDSTIRSVFVCQTMGDKNKITININKEKSIFKEEDDDFVPGKGFYQPSGDDGDESWEAYLALITLLDGQLNGLPRNHVLCGVADEVLAVNEIQ